MEPVVVEPKPSLLSLLCQYLYDQSKDGSPLCDVSVSFSSDCTFQFHKAILALQSNYFTTLFNGNFPESKAKELTVDVCDNVKEPSDVMHNVVAFLYGQPFSLRAEGVSDVLWIVEYLGIDDCWNWCEKMLYIQLTLDNALTIWSLASMFCMTELERTCQGILIPRMQDYVLQQDLLLESDAGLLQLFPSCGLLRFVSQSARADFIVKWGNHDMKGRKDQMRLLSERWSLKKEPLKRALTHSSLTKEVGADLLGKLKGISSRKPLGEEEKNVTAYIVLSYCYRRFSETSYTSSNQWIRDVFVPKQKRKPELFLFDTSVGAWLKAPDILQSMLVQADLRDVVSTSRFTEKEAAVNKQTLVLIKNSDIYLIQTLSNNSSDDLAVLRFSGSDNTVAIHKFWPSFSKELRNIGEGEYSKTAQGCCVMTAEFGEGCLYMVIVATAYERWKRCVKGVYLCTIPLPLNEENCTVSVIPVEESVSYGANADAVGLNNAIRLMVLKDRLIFSYRFGTESWWWSSDYGRLHFVCYDTTRDVFYEYPVPDVTKYSDVLVSCVPEKKRVLVLTGNTVRTFDLESGKWQENFVLKPEPGDCVIMDCHPDYASEDTEDDTEVDWNAFYKNPWCLSGKCKINVPESKNTTAFCLDKDTVAWVGSPAPYVNRLVERSIAVEERDTSWQHLPPPPAQYIGSLSRVSVSRSLLSVLEPATYSSQFKSDFRPFGLCCPDLEDYRASEVVLSSSGRRKTKTK